MTDPPNIEEFIDGAGGTIQDVVKIFRQSLEFMPTALPLIQVFLSSLGDLDMNDSHIKDALVDEGLITSLLKVTPTVLAALQLLRRMFKHSLTARTHREAVEAGIFRAVISCGIRWIGSQVIVEPLRNVLPLCTMYHSVISSVAQSLYDIRDLVSTPAFRTCEILTMWANFRELAELRIRLPRGNLQASSRACGDMECGEIRSKTAFRRCGGCHTVYYCSPNCQRADWARGGHRGQCSLSRASIVEQRERLGSRDESFLRVIVHDYYGTHKHEILAHQLTATRTHPSALIVTVFDYPGGTMGRLSITAHAASTLMKKYPSVDWRDHLSRGIQVTALDVYPAVDSTLAARRDTSSCDHDLLFTGVRCAAPTADPK
ncbi:hypothetical protein B0H16DRAFT_1732033 [Mycena metata]|uniref:MYND-type domain-containing protein n=1 Tax=Mycena metata TaxID=1033252 RepID=A0AAD7I4R2_9AGAR|nr:hypothetical protein B0H16DRAFT_1732033 [Mycena metata]